MTVSTVSWRRLTPSPPARRASSLRRSARSAASSADQSQASKALSGRSGTNPWYVRRRAVCASRGAADHSGLGAGTRDHGPSIAALLWHATSSADRSAGAESPLLVHPPRKHALRCGAGSIRGQAAGLRKADQPWRLKSRALLAARSAVRGWISHHVHRPPAIVRPCFRIGDRTQVRGGRVLALWPAASKRAAAWKQRSDRSSAAAHARDERRKCFAPVVGLSLCDLGGGSVIGRFAAEGRRRGSGQLILRVAARR